MANQIKDLRNIKYGHELPREHYCDQPYVVITAEGHWLCVMTTGMGVEGAHGQHVVSIISEDQGKTWSSSMTDIEPADGPEASWVMPLVLPSGRIYAFYTYNGDNLREVISDVPSNRKRVDTLGYLAYRFSDDHGRTWSADRYYAPIREMEIDRNNPYGGKVQFFWGVGKPMIHREAVYMGIAKVGRFGEGFMACSEGIFLKSDNIMYETDPNQIRWETLPDGEVGIKAPVGPVADEHNVVGLSDGSLYCTYRTLEGHNGQAYSRDGGHTWTAPDYASYSPGGQRLKHPRAANFVRKYKNGHYTLWFHNHGKYLVDTPNLAYRDRNPAWLCGGVERDGSIYWSQPEIVLYDDDPDIRISYPDFIEDQGNYYITETQKTIARVHRIEESLLEGMWNQHLNREVAKKGLVLDYKLESDAVQQEVVIDIPELPSLQDGGGFSVDFRFEYLDSAEPFTLLDTTGADGIGMIIQSTGEGSVWIVLNDGRTSSTWECDRGLLQSGRWHHVAIIVDGGPKIITFVVDGKLCDGGEDRQFGWGRFNPQLRNINGLKHVPLGLVGSGRLSDFRIYNRYLTTSEAVGNYQSYKA